jgi:hypothetical protein
MHCLLCVVSTLIDFGYMHVFDWARHAFFTYDTNDFKPNTLLRLDGVTNFWLSNLAVSVRAGIHEIKRNRQYIMNRLRYFLPGHFIGSKWKPSLIVMSYSTLPCTVIFSFWGKHKAYSKCRAVRLSYLTQFKKLNPNYVTLLFLVFGQVHILDDQSRD